jgi:hypothetical protein
MTPDQLEAMSMRPRRASTVKVVREASGEDIGLEAEK